MANLNQLPEEGDIAVDLYRAAVQLSKAIPKCMDDPEIVDALAFSVAFLRNLLAVELDSKGLINSYDVEIVRTLSESYKKA